MEIAVIVLAVALFIQVIIFSWIQIRKIEKQLEKLIVNVRNSFDSMKADLDSVADTHDRFVDYVQENCALKNEPDTAKAKKKSTGKKRGRPRKVK